MMSLLWEYFERIITVFVTFLGDKMNHVYYYVSGKNHDVSCTVQLFTNIDIL